MFHSIVMVCIAASAFSLTCPKPPKLPPLDWDSPVDAPLAAIPKYTWFGSGKGGGSKGGASGDGDGKGKGTSNSCDHTAAVKRLVGGLPVVLQGTEMAGNAVPRWTDPAYFEAAWPTEELIPVLATAKTSKTGLPIFTYSSRPPQPIPYNQAMFKIDEEQVVQLQLKVSTLLAAIKQPQSASVNATEGVSLSSVGVERKARTPKTLSNRRLYAQGVPLTSERLGPILSRDTEEVPYMYLGAGPSVTPLHFDLGENLLLQVSGMKRVYMWGPGQWDRLAALPLVHPAVQGSAVEDIWDTLKMKALAPRLAGSHAYAVDLEPGDLLYIPRYWWHHVEVTAPPSGGRLGVSISFFLERRGLPPIRPGSNGHRVDMVRKLEGALSKIVGPKPYVALLKKLDRHLAKGRTLETFNAGGNHDEWKHAMEVINYVWSGGGEVDSKVSKSFLNKGETKEQFLQFAIRGRFDVPQHGAKVKEVPRHVTDAEDLDLPPLPTEDELQRKVDGELEDARAEAHKGVMADAKRNLKEKLKADASAKSRTKTKKAKKTKTTKKTKEKARTKKGADGEKEKKERLRANEAADEWDEDEEAEEVEEDEEEPHAVVEKEAKERQSKDRSQRSSRSHSEL